MPKLIYGKDIKKNQIGNGIYGNIYKVSNIKNGYYVVFQK